MSCPCAGTNSRVICDPLLAILANPKSAESVYLRSPPEVVQSECGSAGKEGLLRSAHYQRVGLSKTRLGVKVCRGVKSSNTFSG